MAEHDTIAIDFDGVIHKYSKGWQDGSIYDEPVPGAREALLELAKDFKLVVFTARSDQNAVREWISKKINLSLPVTNIKPPALAYIDDRAVHFTDWQSALWQIRCRLSWRLL